MRQGLQIRLFMIVATVLFMAWTMLLTVFWPVEDYANAALAYAESTNQIARGMSIGVAAYFSAIAIATCWYFTSKSSKAGVPTVKADFG